MRAHAILIASLLVAVATVAVAAPASAAPTVCQEETVDAGLVRTTVTFAYVAGVGCIGAEVETCTLSRPDPDYPSTPVWQCRTLLTV